MGHQVIKIQADSGPNMVHRALKLIDLCSSTRSSHLRGVHRSRERAVDTIILFVRFLQICRY